MRYKSTSCHKKSPVTRWLGIGLMILGGLIVLIAVPVRFWFALLGLLMLIVGAVILFVDS